MNRLHHQRLSIGLLLLCLLGSASLSLFWTSDVQAVLPPRPTVVTPSTDDDATQPEAVVVSQIHLRITPSEQVYWAVVQWQDEQGVWRDVQGWRSEVTQGTVTWWVNEKDFGRGPFRWVVYPQGGPFLERTEGNTIYRTKQPVLAVSQQFNLPTQSSSSLSIYITVPKHIAGAKHVAGPKYRD